MNRPFARAVVVVAYGRPDLLERTLAGLDPDELVLVVDNSADPDVARAAQRHGATYLDAGHNRGFGGGVNVALAHLDATATPGDVLLLNPDAVIGSREIDALQDALHDDPGLAAVAPELSGPDSSAQPVAWPYPSPQRMWAEAFGLTRHRSAPEGFVVGAVLLLRRAALQQVGGFDERFFLYAEETDWQRRAVALGWRSAQVDSAHAEHVGAATSPDPGERDARFHAAQETYVRHWFGARGWASYRAAATVGAAGRAVVLRGRRRAQAADRARLYRRGPARSAPLPPPGRPLRITHVVVTANLAGTERYVLDLARTQAGAGHDVQVIGGDPQQMPTLLGPGVRWSSGAQPVTAGRALRAGGPRDIIHTHLTSADLVGTLTGAWHGARLVSTRHFAAPRGRRGLVRAAVALVQRRIDAEISVSDFVARGIGRASTVVRTGVPTTVEAPIGDESPSDADRVTAGPSRRVVVAQRLEPEKHTAIVLEGWCRSGLAAQGWTLTIAGDGSERAGLRAAFPQPDIDWLGWVDDLDPVLRGADVLLAGAPAEPYGLAVVEAMSRAVPVIAAAAGGHLETVGPVDGAVLFTPADAHDCARALTEFAALDPAARRAYGRRLQEHQRAHLTLARQAQQIESVYRRP